VERQKIASQRNTKKSNAKKSQGKEAVFAVPKCCFDAPDIIFSKVSFGDIFLPDRNTIPLDPQSGRAGALIEDEGKGRVMAYIEYPADRRERFAQPTCTPIF
jgi:hypothetical protein